MKILPLQNKLCKTKDIYWKKIISHKNNELIEDFLCFKDFIILRLEKEV